ncbi:MAG: LysM peptidoglycan-binding domain-containing protein [Anaerolineae bacterium]|nr:LysM peptidoglycan-binding domain-containing protein [Anaerolineae bacterium]
MQHVRQLMIALVALAVLLTTPMLVAAQGGQTTHTVQAGENLTRIALKYGTTVQVIVQANNITNPNLVFVGQVLTIPGAGITPTLQPTGTVSAPPPQPTTAPAGETIHVVQPGENLFRVALKYGLSTAFLASYNGITNPNVIYVGQRIRIPSSAAAQPQPQPATPAPVGATPLPATVAATLVPTNVPVVTMIPAATPTPGMPQNTATNVGFAYGVQLHLPNQNIPQVVQAASALEVTWVKQQIEWAIYEANAGSINWAPLDEIVNALDGAGFNILLSVGSAPGWARDSDQEKGPPTDYQTYANFIGQLAQRYKGKVDAYEVWNEQNLRREWNTPRGISAASYVELLRLAYTAIKNADSSALVVTGGLAPTGFNDGVNAIDDRVYLRQMYAAGVAEWSDAIGAHPNGWANPPDSTCCRNNRPAVPAWDDHPSFFFKQTLADYRQIMVENGDSGTFIWPTEFGWGSNDGLNVEPPPEYAFVAFTSLDEQASYILRGFQLGKELGYIGPMFLWNLNFCPVVGVTGEQCLWSLLDPAGNPRPAYLTLRDLDK